MSKRSLYLLGLVTLLVFPLPTLLLLPYFEDVSVIDIFELENFQLEPIGVGLLLGIAYAIVALRIMKAPVFDQLPSRIETIVANMKLTIFDAFFVSFCAGFGEELLFRSGVQFYLGPIITSVLFVAIHGYLNPMNWRVSLYGVIVLPFILLISYGFIEYGLWFAIAAHFSYDLILFLMMSKDNSRSTYDNF